MRREGRIVIIGAGPTGLGAAYRLGELGYDDYEIYEAEDSAGGLSSSYTDEAGFTWDLGGHVHFSHYPHYDEACRRALGAEGFLTHVRKSFIQVMNRLVRYPFQNHLKDLPAESTLECLLGIAEATYLRSAAPKNFLEWMTAVFGKGVVRLFMEPYNRKVWAHPLEEMSFSWLGERIAVTGLEEALRGILSDDGSDGWGPNNIFRYPKQGGTGLLFARLAEMAGDRLRLGKRLVSVNAAKRRVRFADGTETAYDWLISTIPVDRLISMMTGVPGKVGDAAAGLVHNSAIVVGVGLRGDSPSGRHWLYFPEDRFPFYRLTYLSHYSPALVPNKGGPHLSLLCETSFPALGPPPEDNFEERVIEGLCAAGILSRGDLSEILSVSKRLLNYAYPVPTTDRDRRLRAVFHFLEPLGVLSRGRFGAFRYEVGNMDHSFMQGAEAVERILFGREESVFQIP
jgi:protoporphyrinogen oxidase